MKNTDADGEAETKSTIRSVMEKLQQASDWPLFVLNLTL